MVLADFICGRVRDFVALLHPEKLLKFERDDDVS
jgi:hypothetical protein